MDFLHHFENIENYREFFSNINSFLEGFNNFSLIFFKFLKYILVFILLMIGILTLLKLRGIYFTSRSRSSEQDGIKKSELDKPRLVLGCIYIVLGCGILFNYLIYFLMWILDPLPDRFLFILLNLINTALSEVDFFQINKIDLRRFTNINLAIAPIEKSFYLFIAYWSYYGTIHFLLTLWYLIDKSRPLVNPRKAIGNLFFSLGICLISGFTTFMPFIL